MTRLSKRKIGVIGAGISGLVCAYELQREGFFVEVFEKEPCAGGRMLTLEKEGVLFDAGANFFVEDYQTIPSYCRELQLHKQWQPIQEGSVFGFWQGVLHLLTLSLSEMLLHLQPLSPFARLRLLAVFRRLSRQKGLNFYHLSESAHLDTMDAYSYTLKKVGQQAADLIVDAFASTYQFHSAREISLAAMSALVGQMVNHQDQFAPFQTVGGMRGLPQALAAQLPVHFNAPVEKVTPSQEAISVTVQGRKHEYDAVVLACTADVARVICRPLSKAQQQLLAPIRYAATIMVSYLVLADRLQHLYLVMVPYCEGGKIAVYINEGMKGPQFCSGDRVVFNVALHEEYARTLMEKGDADIFAAVAEAVREVCPRLKACQLEPHLLKRWPAAMPKFAPGYVAQVSHLLKKAQGERGIFFCGDYLNSPWTEGSARCGYRVAKEVGQRLRA